jgi:ZIP family zinc transporter
VLGGIVGSYWDAPQRVSGVLLAFASGALIGAFAFELFPEAFHLGGLRLAGLGLLAGGTTFVLVNTLLDRRVEGNQAEQSDKKQAGRSKGFAIGLWAACAPLLAAAVVLHLVRPGQPVAG